MTQVLQLSNIHKVFNEGTPDEKIALDHINLHLKQGDFVTVIGSNGAGKSTLMNLVSGVLQPDLGEVKIETKNVTYLPEYKRAKLIGRVFQDPMAGTSPTMTIEENLAMAYSRNKRRTLKSGVTKKEKNILRKFWKPCILALKTGFQLKWACCQGEKDRRYLC